MGSFALCSAENIQQLRQKIWFRAWFDDLQQHGEYCDSFVFSTTPGNNQINNFYLNQKELFAQFINVFYENMAAILEELGHNTFCLPEGTGSADHSYLSLFSPQDCAQLLTQGCKTKEIARLLQISPQRVESHISILMDKFKVQNRAQLTYTISKLL